MDRRDIRLSVFRNKNYDGFNKRYEFVKAEHIPSGITVTKCSEENQLKAKANAVTELSELVNIHESDEE